MQYGAEINSYERIRKINTTKCEESSKNIYLKAGILFIMSIFISRTMMINSTAPFGIAFLIVVLSNKNSKMSLISAFGTLLGYITMEKYIKNASMYYALVPIVTIMALTLSKTKLDEKKRKIAMAAVLSSTILIYNLFSNEFNFTMSLVVTVTSLCCIFPIYFMLQTSNTFFKEIKTKHLFRDEEIICMSLVVSILVAGTWGIELFGVSLTNILAFAIVLLFSFTSGSAIGATVGISMGAIIGMSNQSILLYIAVLGMVGLIAGAFKEAGKSFVAISFLVTFLIARVYIITSSVNLPDKNFALIDGIIAVGLFFLIPSKFYNNIEAEINSEKKKINLDRNYLNNIRNIYLGKLDSFSDVLENMSTILADLVDNDKLMMQTKSAELIDNLATRVCSECNANCICWSREHHATYSAFAELIENKQKNIGGFPIELERKCLKKGALTRNSEDVVNKYIINEMWRNRLSEGRELLSNQINNMAKSVEELVDEFNEDIETDGDLERDILKLLEKNALYYDDVFCIVDDKGRDVVRITSEKYESLTIYSNKILPLINEATGKSMIINEDKCNINPKTNKCTIVFEEAPNFKINTYVAKASKEGFNVHGDSFVFGNMGIGNYMTVLSDGMGSGPQAGRESEAAVELIEKFTGAGFSKITAINTVNSIMTLKFCEEEKFSTIDLASIDLYTGEIDFMKVGAVASFIKSDDTVDIIKSKSLPIGVLDEADIETYKREIKHGDLIVMISDGISDVEEGGRIDWILDYMIRHEDNVEELANGIIEEAKKISKNKVNDDMTVIVSKVSNVYN
ncbi:stage II sporulation protein E [Clostridium ihumii]|uniref:stage II sporulation protein E n=1 Tax=Clostridium ihumii TaxID=1470356 RepID=UPI00058DA15A|nr:stage II sporulation protein E [Clostridium ihumii]